jgi:ABC-type multidrug transport system fused ATPase/permease subunit
MGEPRQRTDSSLVRRLLALSLLYRRECAGVFFLQVVLLALGVAGLGLSGVAVDVIRAALDEKAPAPRWPFELAPPAGVSTPTVLYAIGALVLAMATLRALLSFSYSLVVGRLVHLKFVPELRARVFDKLQRLSFRFFDDNATGSIINRVTGDVQSVRMFVDGVLLQGLIMLLSLGVYLVYMLRTHALLTGVCLALAPVLWLVTTRFSGSVRPAYAEGRRLVDRMVLAMSEGVRGMLVVKTFGREDYELARFDRHNDEVREQQRAVFRRVSRFGPTISFTSQLNLAVLMVYGGSLVARHALSLGELIVFAGLLQQFSSQVASIAVIVNTLQQSLAGARRVFEVLDAPLDVASPSDPIRPARFEGRIRFENVGFRWSPSGDRGGQPDDAAALTDVDFEIRPGECVAVVGVTGAGKSTLLSLVPRFFDATDGRVLVDGVDVRRLDLDELRRNVGLVFQEGLLFRATVAENVAFAAPQASRDRVEHAARLAGAHEFVTALPDGYDTLLEEGGSNLSGGQRQRLAIARAILTEPPILLLDDPTTAVDAATEREVLDAIDSARVGRTTIIVANRLTTLRRADRILVLDEGRLVEQGSHDELVRLRGVYFRMARLQAADAESARLLGRMEARA